MAVSVLYIHHIGVFGGASRSLLELIRAFPPGEVKAHLISQQGKVPKIFSKYGVDIIETVGLSQIDHTRFGFYRAARWLILLRELGYVPFTVWSMLKARWKWRKIDIVHVNEITNGLSIVLAKVIFHCPLIVHVRSVQEKEKGVMRRKIVSWLMAKADIVIAIDSTVRKSLPESQVVHIVHNGLILEEKPLLRVKYDEGSTFSEKTMIVLFVGALTVMKGILDLLHAARMCADDRLNVQFVVVGDYIREQKGVKNWLLNKVGFSYDVKGYCEQYIAEYQLENMIVFKGFTLDIEKVYQDADVLCFPSHLDAAGRPVVEASLLSIPSIVTISDSFEDVIIHKKTGLCINKGDGRAIFNAVKYYYLNPAEIERMGKEAYQLAKLNFDISKNAKKILDIYKSSLGEK